jgi:predicted phosphodiesterase
MSVGLPMRNKPGDVNQFQILHISDLHIRDIEDFDCSLVLDPLIERVRLDIKDGIKPGIVIVTGDIAFKGIAPEYRLAKVFFDKLLACLKLPNERLFIVPGNHDVNRDKYKLGEEPSYKDMRELNIHLENKGHRQALLKGMKDYFKFIHKNYPHLKSKHGNLIPFVVNYRCECGKNIGIIGLNSAWMCRKLPDKGNIAIGEYQVKKALDELEEKGNIDIGINCFHHPLEWLWHADRNRCRRFFNNSVLLAGHLHDAAGGLIKDLDGTLYQFQAGGSYLGSESDWPQRYHYITFDWKENHIKLDFRKYVKERRKWCLDGETGDDGTKILEMIYARSKHSEISLRYPIGKTSGPFQPGGGLPEDAVSYIKRKCDDELVQFIESKEKKLIAINGDFEIGKSSLLNRVMYVPFLANNNWKKYFCDVQGVSPSELANFVEYFFREFSSCFKSKIDSWETLDLFLLNQAVVLCFDEFGIFSDYEGMAGHFIQNLCIRAQKSDNVRVIVCLNPPIEEFIDNFSKQYFANPKFRRCWQKITIKSFNENQAKQLLGLLPDNARKIALKNIDIIEKFSSFKPRQLQCLCDKLFDAVNDTCDESILVDIIKDEASYS